MYLYRDYIKRGIDILFGLIALPFVLLLTLVIGPLIYLEDRGTIFYKAKRRGKDGKIFTMYKFRSMKMNAPDIRNEDNSTFQASDDPRLTKVGRIIRKFSIDEIPQFINVLRGDMSLIGPRPVTIDKPLSEYDEKRKIRLQVRPGITGYSQAYYRNSISQEEKFEYDAKYAMNVTFALDVKIFLKTVQSVLLCKNIYSEKQKGNYSDEKAINNRGVNITITSNKTG